MNNEKYQVKKEDIKNAEDAMSPQQKELSEIRESAYIAGTIEEVKRLIKERGLARYDLFWRTGARERIISIYGTEKDPIHEDEIVVSADRSDEFFLSGNARQIYEWAKEQGYSVSLWADRTIYLRGAPDNKIGELFIVDRGPDSKYPEFQNKNR